MATNSAAAAKPLAYEDDCALPDDEKRYEVLDGVLVVRPAPIARAREHLIADVASQRRAR